MLESRVTLDPKDLRAFDVLFGSQRGPAAAHRLVWSLFPDHPRGERTFIFDVVGERPFTAVVRSREAPRDGLGAWQIETRELKADFAPGTRLAFRVKAVASASDRQGPDRRGRRRDVARHLHERGLPEGRRESFAVGDLSETAGLDWLERQGKRAPSNAPVAPDRAMPPHGFELEREACWLDRSWPSYARTSSGHRAVFTVYDLRGILRVTDGARFGRMLLGGLGRGRAFGFGLMHVAPAEAAAPLRQGETAAT